MTVRRSLKVPRTSTHGAAMIPCCGDFLRDTEDPSDYQNFRRVQVLALEPRSINELQIALTIADIGWDIHRHTTALDRLEREQKLIGRFESDSSAAGRASVQWERVEIPKVLSKDGRDRSTVPFSSQTDPRCKTLVASASYHEARIAELEARVETLSNSMRLLRRKSKALPLIVSNSKLQ